MAVEFVGIDPDTDLDHCPTVWADAEAQEILLQGWKPSSETQAECETSSPANGGVPSSEAIVRIPARMIPMIREACDAVERARLRELLGRCERSAVHLELRDAYASTDRFEAWKRGERINWADREAWWHPFHQSITDAAARGITIRRARVVSEPVSEYIRWEHYVTQANVMAGEEVRWLPRRRATDIPLPGNDFWLFDGALLRVHHFSGDGAVVEDEFTADPEAVKLCSTAFETVWERAIPHHLFKI